MTTRWPSCRRRFAWPRKVGIARHLGQKLQLAKRDAQAIQSFRQALGLDANLDSAHYGIGLALQVLGRLKEAADEWNTALRINPANAYAHYCLGRHARQQADWIQAEPTCRQRPDFSRIWLKLTASWVSCIERKRNLQKAEESFQAALRPAPKWRKPCTV